MKVTEQDIQFFKNLSQTETGRYLADFVKRAIDYVYDSRGWSDKDTPQSAARAAQVIQEEILDRIRLKKKDGSSEYEFE